MNKMWKFYLPLDWITAVDDAIAVVAIVAAVTAGAVAAAVVAVAVQTDLIVGWY